MILVRRKILLNQATFVSAASVGFSKKGWKNQFEVNEKGIITWKCRLLDFSVKCRYIK